MTTVTSDDVTPLVGKGLSGCLLEFRFCNGLVCFVNLISARHGYCQPTPAISYFLYLIGGYYIHAHMCAASPVV